jgi:hypothetical protein
MSHGEVRKVCCTEGLALVEIGDVIGAGGQRAGPAAQNPPGASQ